MSFLRPSRVAILAALGPVLLLCGCASDYVARTASVRRAYESGNYPQALTELERQQQHGHDQDTLLYLMDEGMLLHAAGRYQDSIPVLDRAEKLADQLDVTSLHEEAAALATSERLKWYRGEDFEHVLINVLQGLNYACIGKPDDALVEERRVNEKLLRMINDEKKPFQQLAIARYLSGVLYEDQGRLDDAFIDYRQALALQPSLASLAEPLLRIAQATRRDQDLEELAARFPGVSTAPLAPDEGQVVIVIEEGLAPRKVRDSGRQDDAGELITVPVFVDRGRPFPPAVSVDGSPWQGSEVVTDLSRVAKIDLDDRIGKLLARQMLGTAVKAGIAAGTAAVTKNEGVGLLTFWALSLTNQTDLRSWMSLPAQFDLARYRLKAGPHEIVLDRNGRTLTQTVQVQPGRISLWVVRIY